MGFSMKQPKYPVYILSKGRWESRLTSKTFEEIGVNYRIVVEENEYDQYAAVIDKKKIIVLPSDFRENPKYAIKDDLGQCGGGIPVRNFIWEHSIAEGHERHWIVDDNIRHLFRSHKNTRLRVYSTAPFLVVEDFVERFTNIRLAGLNYNFFMPANVDRPAYSLNTRIYSFILIDNSIKHRWRGKYNEDTDLSLRVLKDGDCTFLLNAFTCGKAATHTMKGGNTETVYKVGSDEFDNRRIFAESLKHHHPDCVEVTQKWGRWHHHVDYDRFACNIPKPKPGLVIPNSTNEYGLRLVRIDENLKPQKLISITDKGVQELQFEE